MKKDSPQSSSVLPCDCLLKLLMKGEWHERQPSRQKTAWFGIGVCVCVGSNKAERRVSGSYLYSSGFGYPWIHLGDWEACIKGNGKEVIAQMCPLLPHHSTEPHSER